jgi:hypothetical protein
VNRGLKALATVALVVVVIAVGARLLSGNDSDEAPAADGPERVAATVPPVPDDAPAEGLYVRSDVTEDGEVVVQTWLRTATPISELRLTTTDPDLLPGSVESLDLRVRTLEGGALARRDSVGTNPQRIKLRTPVTELYFTYTVDGGLDDASQTVEGRRLARVLAMDVDYDGAGAAGTTVRRLVTGPGTVINVACLRPSEDFDAVPRPCGQSTPDGDWLVDLAGKDGGDRLLAQLED